MTFLQYLSRTVYRYYMKTVLLRIPVVFTKRAAVFLEVDFRNPKTLTNGDMRNPKTLTNADMRNPKTLTNADMELRTEIT